MNYKIIKNVFNSILDIAGTAWTTEDKACYRKGATGFGVRLLLEWLSQRD